MTTKRLKGFSVSKLEKLVLGKPLSFGMAVEALRVRDELSQSKLAKKIGISRQYLCDIEKGRKLVSPIQAVRFAKAFGHPPQVFITLALQDSLDSNDLSYTVLVKEAA